MLISHDYVVLYVRLLIYYRLFFIILDCFNKFDIIKIALLKQFIKNKNCALIYNVTLVSVQNYLYR